jgi:putative hydrolase of the HAD superfamily
MKVLIFDLDDTLYNYSSFVASGFTLVAKYLSPITNISKRKIKRDLFRIYNHKNQSRVFDELINRYNLKRKYIKKCILIYRHSSRNLNLYIDAFAILKKFKKKCYLITDGSKLVQKNKIKCLKVKKFFKKIFITNSYGKKYNKPSIYCFKKIKNLEKCKYKDLVYIGDNPYKDFVNCKKKGMVTIRILRGYFKNIKLNKKFEADYEIINLSKIKNILNY